MLWKHATEQYLHSLARKKVSGNIAALLCEALPCANEVCFNHACTCILMNSAWHYLSLAENPHRPFTKEDLLYIKGSYWLKWILSLNQAGIKSADLARAIMFIHPLLVFSPRSAV